MRTDNLERSEIITETQKIISDLEYSAYNLCDGRKDTDLPVGIVETTDAKDSLLIAIRDLKNLVSKNSV